MKIVHVTSSFPPFVGGISSAVESLVSALCSLSIEQSVYAVQRGKILRTASSTYSNVKVHYWFMPDDYLVHHVYHPMMKMVKRECIWDKVILHFHSATIFSHFYTFLYTKICVSSRSHAQNMAYKYYCIKERFCKGLMLKVLVFKLYKELYAAPPGMTSLHAMPNPEDFGEKMAALLMNEELYEKFSRNARKWALRHLWSKILPEYDKLYDTICA